MISEFWLAPLVVALRLPVIAQEMAATASGRMPTHRRLESERMVTEKLAALAEGVLQAQLEVVKVNVEIGLSTATGNLKQARKLVQDAPMRIARAAAAPGGRRVRHNARRLAGG